MGGIKKHKRKEPLIRIAKREGLSKPKTVALKVCATVLALVAGGLFIAAQGHNPFSVYFFMVKGALGTKMSFQETVKVAIPLLISSLGITLAFRMRFWNIGAEGQIIVGAIAASYFALYKNTMPHAVLMSVMALAAIVAGGIWAGIPAFFKSRFGTNETLLTLMFNYIAQYMIQYLREGPWKDPNALGFLQIARFSDNARLGSVLGIQAGWIVALLLTVAVYIYINFTKSGYELRVVGESENTARYAGMNVKRIMMRTMFISGAVCGLAGMLQASGTDRTLTDTVAGGVGFTAIIVAWLANLSAPMILVVTALFSILEKGISFIQSRFMISSAAAAVLQGIILFFVLGFEFFTRYRLVLRREAR
ncbi:MAG: Branched-chain amino acid transport system / permease component [Firmicutes bacterium ADurb.Bin193]|nr:MAG: Branched-chain amino acid transport system / permease component [Firmicutes bacterium ADurb.Bin193]